MRNLYNFLQVGCLSLILSFATFNVSYAEVTYPHNMTINAQDIQMANLGENFENLVKQGHAKKNTDGSYTVVIKSAADQQTIDNAVIDAKKRNREQAAANMEGQGLEIGGDTNGQKTPDILPPPPPAPDISEDFQNSVNDELDDEISEIEIAGVDLLKGSSGDLDSFSGGNADGSGGKGGMGGVCGELTSVFSQIACKAMMFLIDLRILAYIISGFGMVAFAWAAIFNKISWKHFSQIGMALFMLSMIGPFIEYFSGDDTVTKNLEYGNYLGGKYQGIEGAAGADCKGGKCPDTNTKVKKKWSLKDLKGSIQSGLNMARGAYNTYQSAKATIQTVKQNADTIKNAIKNGGGGLEGILGAATQIAGATNNIMFAGKTGLNALGRGAGDIANAAQDTFTTNEQRQENNNIRLNGENGKTTNTVANFFSGDGAGGKAINNASNAANTISKGATGVGVAANAGYEGKKMGGDKFGGLLGGVMAAGTMVGEGAGLATENSKPKAPSKKQQQENIQSATNNAMNIMNNAANDHMKTVQNTGLVGQQNQTNAEIDKKVENQISNGASNASLINMDKKNDRKVNSDKSIEYTSPNGTSLKVNPDGSREYTLPNDGSGGNQIKKAKLNPDGSIVAVTADGKIIKYAKDSEYAKKIQEQDRQIYKH